MYRLLFLFYIEARPELGYAPLKSEAYRKGYSLEHLRDLELVRLTSGTNPRTATTSTRASKPCSGLIREGFDGGKGEPCWRARMHNTFEITPLDSALFRKPTPRPLLNTREAPQRNPAAGDPPDVPHPASKGPQSARRGRISYAQLGINQLGAVYEALLSYRGFFAEEDLYEVKRAGEGPGRTRANAWFVPLSELHKYSEEERVFVRGRRSLCASSRFTPRAASSTAWLAGTGEKTASYYTPESLTRCVVKYALKELIRRTRCPPARILDLTICEPAMGSAAFLNEAVNPTGGEVPGPPPARTATSASAHEDYADELQKVKHYIADRNVFGVDLNPWPSRTGRSVAVAELHPQGRPCALVRLPTGVRQLADRRPPAGVFRQREAR